MKNIRSEKKATASGIEIYLRSLTPEDVSHDYADWLNDGQTAQYLESRHMNHTLESCVEFVKQVYESDSDALLGIFQNDTHVGNIKIGGIHPLYRRGDVGLMISRSYWGRGIGKLAIALTEDIAFGLLGLHKLYAGAYRTNKGSIRAFLSNGWDIVGEMKDHFIVDGHFVDSVWMEKLNRRIMLRAVQPSDIKILFELANDPVVRANSFSPETIDWPEHERWFNVKLHDKNNHMYVAVDNNEIVIGQVRVDMANDIGVISLSIFANCRGRGYGADMLNELIDMWDKGTFHVRHMVGRVKIDNTVSQKTFQKAGFIETILPDYLEYWYPSPEESVLYGEGESNVR